MPDVRSLLAEGVRRHRLGGAALAVVRAGKQPAFECMGWADRPAGRRVDPDTLFRIASISKTMTAIAVLQLRDEGRLALDDPVNDHLRTFTVQPPPGGAAVTVRHLLTHTAGIGELPRPSDVFRPRVFGMGKPGAPPADLASVFRGTLRTETPAGEKWAYANFGFAVLGQVVEDVSGRPLAAYMGDRLFAPLDMPSTGYGRVDGISRRLATGSHRLLGRLRSVRDYDLTLHGPGGVLSSPVDMATYAGWLFHGGAGRRGDVLAAATLAEMHTPHHRVDPRLPGVGLAFFVSRMGEHKVVGHDGNVPGYSSALLVAPDAGVGVVVLTNTATLFGANLIAAASLRALLGVPDPADALANTSAEAVANPYLWSELAGAYAPAPGLLTNVRFWQAFGGEAQVVVRGGRLVLRALSPFRELRGGVELHPVDPADPLLFAFRFEGRVVLAAFSRDGQGRVDRLAVGSPANAALYRRSPLRSARTRRRLLGGAALAAEAYHLRRRRRRRRRR